MIKKCPKCGFENHHEEDLTKFSECSKCGIIYTKYEEIQNRKSKEKKAEQSKKFKEGTEKQSGITKYKKRNIIAFVIGLFAIVSIIGFILIRQIAEHAILKNEQTMVSEIETLTTMTIEKQEACNQYLIDGFTIKKRDGYAYITNIDTGIELCEQVSVYGKKLNEKFIEFSKPSNYEFMGFSKPSHEKFMAFLNSKHGRKALDTISEQFVLQLDLMVFFQKIFNLTFDFSYVTKAFSLKSIEQDDKEKQDYLFKVFRFKEIGEEILSNKMTHTNEMSNYFKEKR
jgi:hypothetical protein